MTKGDVMTDEINEESGGIDRRSMLVKAAAAGGIVWAAPLIVSSPALASSCTPSCAAGSFVPQLGARDVCGNDVTNLRNLSPAVNTFIGNSNKMVVLSILAPPTLSCPCGTAAPFTVIGGIPSTFGKVSSSGAFPGSCTLTPGQPDIDTFSLAGTAYVDPNDASRNASNSFLAGKNGAIPNAVYASPAQICVAVGCKDARGRTVYNKCRFTLCFDYTPAGSCFTFVPLNSQFTLVPNSCVAGCSAAC